MTTTKQIFTGDASQLENAYKSLAQQVTRLEDKLHQLSASSQRHHESSLRGGQAIQNALKNQILSVVSLTGAWNAAEQAVAAVNRQMEFHQRLTDKAKGTQLTVAESQAAVIKNMTAGSSGERAAFLKQIEQIREATGFQDVKELNLAAAEGLSAGGSPKQVAAAIRAAARISKDKPEDLRTLVGAALDIGKASGVADPARNLGFLLSAGEKARVAGLQNTARNLSPAVITGVNTVPGQDPVQAAQEIAAFFSAATQMTGDVRGDRSQTFTESYAVQLRNFFEKGREISGPGGRKLRIKPPSDPGTFQGRIAALQADPSMGRQFLEGASFERQFQISAEQSLQKGSLFGKMMGEAKPDIQFNARSFEQMAGDLKGLTKELQLANQAAATTGATQQFELSQTREAREALVRDVVRDAFEKTAGAARLPLPSAPGGLATPLGAGTALGKKFLEFVAPSMFEPRAVSTALYAAGQSGAEPEAAGIGLLRLRQQQILSKRRTMVGFARGPSDLSAGERTQYDFLAQQIAGLRANAEEQLTVSRQQLEELRKRTPAAGPAANQEPGRHRER